MPPESSNPAKFRSRQAFTLIEVTLALGVAGFCLLSIFGLLPLGLTSNQASIEQTVAANLSSAIVSDLRTAESIGANVSPRFGLAIPASEASPATQMHTVYFATDGSATTV